METKAFEIRDAGTFIPAVAVRMVPSNYEGEGAATLYEGERYLLRRAGFAVPNQMLLLCQIDGGHSTYDPHLWRSMTMTCAHWHIMEHWDKLKSGDVIDVEFIRGQTDKPKLSERLTAPI